MTQEEYDEQLKIQIEEKRKAQFADKLQDQEQLLRHYQNYQIGSSNPVNQDLADLNSLMHARQQQLQEHKPRFVNYQESPAFGFHNRASSAAKASPSHAEPVPAYKQYAKPDPKSSNIFFGGGGGGSGSSAAEKQASLFSDNFVADYRHFNKGKQENLMNLPNLFPPPVPQSRGSASSAGGAGETERERRLRLRDIERKKRLEGISGGGYGALERGNGSSSHSALHADLSTFENPSFASHQRSFDGPDESATVVSKRDLVWQQK